MAKLVAIKEHLYDSVLRKPGEEYEATDKHANILKRVGKAKDGSSPAPAPEPAMETRQVQAEEETQPEPETTRRRRYQRRDLQSEG